MTHLVLLLVEHLEELMGEHSVGPETPLLPHITSISSGSIITNGLLKEFGVMLGVEVGLLPDISISTDHEHVRKIRPMKITESPD